ncbi:MAG TPA: hypothetical protein VHB49_08580 [Bradyrhizobium sp.]|nr:hypothetical protein [Bradyrhizobium sp.]
MKRFFFSACLVLQMCGTSVAFDDGAVCERLTAQGTGLYLAYPAGIAASEGVNCDPSGFCFRKVGAQNRFDESGRFFFVGSPTPPSEEVVWHVRMQTLAANLDSADLAFLSRPTTTTRCSPNEPLAAFPASSFPMGPFVPINDYIDHHEGRPVGLLTRYFHFQIQDPPGGRRCISTDDRTAFADQKNIYGFENVRRLPKEVAQALAIGSARASANAYASLSSEFIYRDDPRFPCFGFDLPRPTRTGYLNEKINWGPYQTKVWIKRFRGRQVTAESKANGRIIQWLQ